MVVAPGAGLRRGAQPPDRRADPTRRLERRGLARRLAGRPRPVRLDRPVPRTPRSSGCRRGPRGRPRSSSSARRGTPSPTAIAPVVPTGGFITAVILLVWLLAYAADDFAHRAEAPIEAAVPSGVLFLVGTALGGNRNRLLATALWLAAAVLTVAILRVERSEGAGWFGGPAAGAVPTTVRCGRRPRRGGRHRRRDRRPGAARRQLRSRCRHAARAARRARRSAPSSTSRPDSSTRATRSCSPSPAPGRPTGG